MHFFSTSRPRALGKWATDPVPDPRREGAVILPVCHYRVQRQGRRNAADDFVQVLFGARKTAMLYS